MNNTKPAYTPTPEEIAREAAKIKAEYLASRCVRGDAKIGRKRLKTAHKSSGVRCGGRGWR